MKSKALLITLVAIIPSAIILARADGHRDDPPQKVERSVVVDPGVRVSLCVASGSVSVRGGDRNEVRVKSENPAKIEFRQDDVSAGSVPKKLEVLILDKSDAEKSKGECQAFSDVELEVPRGATVHVQTRDGNIDIVGVATAFAGTQNGDVDLEHLSRSAEVCSIGGSVSLKDSSGRVTVNSIGGNVEVVNVGPKEPGDAFEVSTVSGDISLDLVTHAQLNARTVNGNVNMVGPLTRGGKYGFKTVSGDVSLTLPDTASFRLSAKVAQNEEIITDFPLTLTTETSPGAAAVPTVTEKPVYTLRRISAVHGTGDATIYIASFSGTLHLQKK